MAQDNELLRRLRRIPRDRRTAFLQQVHEGAASSGAAPVSSRQEQLWLLHKLSDRPGYELAFRIDLTGELDLSALTAAIERVFARHDVLRSTMPGDGDTAVRQLRSRPPQPLTPADLRHLSTSDAEDNLAHAVVRELRQGFDWDNGPQVQLRLYRLADRHHVLLWLTHYLVFDPESMELVLDDLSAGYEAAAAGQLLPVEAPKVSFSDYATWQRAWLSDRDRVEPALAHWRTVLAGWQTTEVLADLPRPRTLDLAAATVRGDLPAGLVSAVSTTAERLGTDPTDVLLAAYVVLLTRYAARDDILVGLPTRATEPAGVDRAVGDCGNLVPIRTDLHGAGSFAEVVGRVRATRVAALAYSALPFSEVLASVARPARDPSRLPLAPVGFEVRTTGDPTRVVGGLALSLSTVDTGTATFELLLTIHWGQRPQATVTYASTLYRRPGMRRLLDRYVELLAAAVADPSTRPARLPLVSPAEREWIADLNRTDAPRLPTTVHEWFAQTVAAQPDELAVVSRRGSFTYRELDRRANQLAHHLRALAVGPERIVGVFLDRGPDQIAAVLAVLKAGGAYVPLDPEHPGARLEAILTDARAAIVLTQSSLLERLPVGDWRAVAIDEMALGTMPTEAPVVFSAPESLAYVIYTSGTTGRPKGVLIEHRNVTNFVHTVRDLFHLTSADRVLQFASLGFDVSVFEIFGALLNGAQLYTVDSDERRSLDQLDQVLVDQRITVVDLPPALMELLPAERYPQLRVAFVGGEAFTGELTTRWAAGRAFYNGYGPTETTVTVVAKHCTGTWTTSPPIGTAMTNVRAYTTDGELGLTPVGVPGELTIGGLGVGRGYLGAPALTADRFRPDPLGPPGARAYLTGDLAMWRPEGELVFLGRMDRQVKIRGIRIELDEVEAAILAHADVQQTVVRPIRNLRQDMVLVAYVTARPGATVDVATLRAELTTRLPQAMVPSYLVAVEAIPLTASGKVDERRLPEVDLADTGSTVDDDVTWTPTERRLVEEVFQPLIGSARIGPHDNFFALGGTSLQAIRVIPRVRAVFGVEVPVAEFFQVPTVSALALVVDRVLSAVHDRDAALADVLAQVESWSDEEVVAMLRDRFGAES
jgi:amino acid adenylation domain-containing protein